MSGRRTPVLDTLRRHPDPQRSTDPNVRAVLDALAELEYAPAPDLTFRNELRAQLVAVAPGIVEESPDAAPEAAPARARHSAVAAAPRARRSIGRPLAIAASVVVVLAMVLAGATWMSQKSLPGDTLYGLKRASENVRLSLASNSVSAAHDRLEFAATRVEEASRLLGRAQPQADAAPNASAAALISQSLTAADRDVLSASRALNKAAVFQHSTAPLTTLLNWAPAQLTRLQSLAAAMPSGALRTRTITSWGLVKSAWTRSTTLRAVAGCGVSGARNDRFGPVPAAPCATSTPAKPATPHVAPTAHRPAHKSGGAGTTSKHSGAATHSRSGTGSSRSGTNGGAPVPALPTPSAPALHLPKPKISPPVKVSSCGVSLAVGPVSANLGSCPSSHK
ncbi:DUF5667 domain-containing protein [uncultured Jatrophihabitans sp.]|uniref:DUF5667 domain-containing protein n=1 Tax=uncultured Jatrophihabitans sp. TaxID=1610747 RepID=UPI0035CC1A2E